MAERWKTIVVVVAMVVAAFEVGAAPPSAAASASMVAVGDVAGCTAAHQPAGSKATVNLIANQAGPVAILGDSVNGPSTKLQDYQNCFAPFWGRFLNRISPVPGNHDYLTSGASGYFDYYGSRAGGRGQGYYVTSVGSWQVFALNSKLCTDGKSCGPGTPMYEWLRTQLTAKKATCQLAFFHRPRWSQGPHGNTAGLAPIYSLLYGAGVELVLSGHDHTYQRFPPLNSSGAKDPNGIVQVVAGTGGASHYSFKASSPAPVVRNNTTFGVVALQLDAASWSLRFVPEAGKTFTDSASGTCHGPKA